MKPLDLTAFAREHFAGDVAEAMRSVLTMKAPARHHWSTTYCTSKVLVALWARALSSHLSNGMTVDAVSPGNAPTTNAGRRQPWAFRAMIKVADLVGPAMGMAASVSTGARRYLDAAQLGDDVTGDFFASPPGKLVGPLTKQSLPHLADAKSVEACWSVLGHLTGEHGAA